MVLRGNVLSLSSGWLQMHAPEVTAEVKDTYTTTMSNIYLRLVKTYLTDLMKHRAEAAQLAEVCSGPMHTPRAGLKCERLF